MRPLHIALPSTRRTEALGRRLGALLRPGDFIGLEGELGAGKTTLIRAVAEGAGVAPRDVSSPTFGLFNLYAGRTTRLLHGDLYRLADDEELVATGFFDQLAEVAALVEWIDRVPSALPPDSARLALHHAADGTRSMELSARGPRSTALLTDWADAARRAFPGSVVLAPR